MILHPKVQEVLEKHNLSNLTEVQVKTIPLFSKQDLIIQSPTGTGKTLAFAIPIANFIHTKRSNLSPKKIHALIIAPTRELALQVESVISLFDLKCKSYIGGTQNQEASYNILTSSMDVMIATPGRLFQIVKYNQVFFSNLQILVLDEADKLLNIGFSSLLENILNLLPKQRRTGLFTATFDDSLVKLSKASLRDFIKITVDNSAIIPEKLTISYVLLKPFMKINALMRFINDKSIVFFSSSMQVDFFFALFTKITKDKIYKIHGKMKNEERQAVYENYCRDGISLFCTDLAARGIDFKDVKSVIHFDCPIDPANFIHRSGRTARNGKFGEGILFLMENEKPFINYLRNKNIIIKKIDLEKVDGQEEILSVNDEFTKEIELKNFENKDEHLPDKRQDNFTNLNSKACNISEKSIDSIIERPISIDSCYYNLYTDDHMKKIKPSTVLKYDEIKAILSKEMKKSGLLAFVSYIRSYKEYHLGFIFNLKEIDFDSTMALYFLEKVPQMRELQNIKFKRFLRPLKGNKLKNKVRKQMKRIK